MIVATSTLELGIDVGDLDRVIQIDAPATVSSFLQRMGRTGRRQGATPNTLFLITKPEYLLRALGLSLLWERGFVEPVSAPPRPLHIVAQQLLALCLQEHRVGENTWFEWLAETALANRTEAAAVAAHMRHKQMIESDQGMLFIGEQAEKAFGRRHFMELVSVFTTPPLVEVRHGRTHLGSVHESSFLVRDNQQPVVLLAGRSWALEQIDWRRRLAYVVPATDPGKSRWVGSGPALSFDVCRAMRDVLSGSEPPVELSQRAIAQLAALRQDFEWVSTDSTTLVTSDGRTRWWTFGGTLTNLELAWRLGPIGETGSGTDELSVPVRSGTTPTALRAALDDPRRDPLPIDPQALTGLKFNECLATDVAQEVLRARAQDPGGVAAVSAEGISSLRESE